MSGGKDIFLSSSLEPSVVTLWADRVMQGKQDGWEKVEESKRFAGSDCERTAVAQVSSAQ